MWPTHLRDTTLILVNRCRTILLISFAVTLALGLSAPNFALNVASADAQGTAHPYVTAMAMQQRAAATVVPADWSLIPAGLAPGDQFRLLFLSSTKRDGASSDIATYNTFIQNRGAMGHADIQPYSSGFRALGCTAASDARDNTGTTYTGADKGVSIYWLRGSRVADDYEDFYDGSWDDEANGKNESGANGPNTSQSTNYPFTGCQHDGTESGSSGLSRALGSGSFVRVGLPNESSSGNGPIGSLFTLAASDSQPFYGLSEVFVVATPTGGVTVNPTEVTVTEGGTATYTVVLDSEPTGNVTVTIQDPTGNTDVTADPVSLTFTDQTWSTAQTVTVRAAEDDNGDDETVTITHTVAGYRAVTTADDVTVTVEDDAPDVTASAVGQRTQVTPLDLPCVFGRSAVNSSASDHRAGHRTVRRTVPTATSRGADRIGGPTASVRRVTWDADCQSTRDAVRLPRHTAAGWRTLQEGQRGRLECLTPPARD